jgi:hypothetical protein
MPVHYSASERQATIYFRLHRKKIFFYASSHLNADNYYDNCNYNYNTNLCITFSNRKFEKGNVLDYVVRSKLSFIHELSN